MNIFLGSYLEHQGRLAQECDRGRSIDDQIDGALGGERFRNGSKYVFAEKLVLQDSDVQTRYNLYP